MNIIHRDLAARNVLISFNLAVKVADFGLSRDVEVDSDYYMMRSETPIPLKWTAPEAIKERKYSAASDVYSFGVLCFEVFSFGVSPFAAYRDQSKLIIFLAYGTEPVHQPLIEQLLDVLTDHGVLEVPPVVEALLEGCLKREAVERLMFEQVIELTGRATRDGVPIKRGLEGESAGAGAGAGGTNSYNGYALPTNTATAEITASPEHGVISSDGYEALPAAFAVNIAVPPTDGSASPVLAPPLDTHPPQGAFVHAPVAALTAAPAPLAGGFNMVRLEHSLEDDETRL
jgi:serine/threonine protein kinase